MRQFKSDSIRDYHDEIAVIESGLLFSLVKAKNEAGMWISTNPRLTITQRRRVVILPSLWIAAIMWWRSGHWTHYYDWSSIGTIHYYQPDRILAPASPPLFFSVTRGGLWPRGCAARTSAAPCLSRPVYSFFSVFPHLSLSLFLARLFRCFFIIVDRPETPWRWDETSCGAHARCYWAEEKQSFVYSRTFYIIKGPYNTLRQPVDIAPDMTTGDEFHLLSGSLHFFPAVFATKGNQPEKDISIQLKSL